MYTSIEYNNNVHNNTIHCRRNGESQPLLNTIIREKMLIIRIIIANHRLVIDKSHPAVVDFRIKTLQFIEFEY